MRRFLEGKTQMLSELVLVKKDVRVDRDPSTCKLQVPARLPPHFQSASLEEERDP